MNHEAQACPGSGAGTAQVKTARRRPRFRVLVLGAVDGNHNMIHAINNACDVVGAALNGMRNVEAFVSNGRKRHLGTLGGVFSAAHGINNAGQIVGGSLTGDNQQFHAFLFTGSAMYDLNELIVGAAGWELVQAVGINVQGQIVGVGLLNGKDHVFLLHPDQTTRRRRAARPRVV